MTMLIHLQKCCHPNHCELGPSSKRVLSMKDTSGDSALKGGIPVISSNKIIPTDHQSAA